LDQVTDETLAAARKVIAVHINSPSRAAQRGRNEGGQLDDPQPLENRFHDREG